MSQRHGRFRVGLIAISMLFAIAPPFAPRALAFEADQFTVPDKPLADIGPELDAHVSRVLAKIVRQVNLELAFYDAALKHATFEPDRIAARKAITRRLDDDYLIGRFYDLLAHGWPETHLERWLRKQKFKAQPARFDVDYDDCIYADTAAIRPLLTIGVAPTVKLHGVYQSTDKIGHFLQQGFEYYRAYRVARRDGESEAKAVQAAIDVGVDQESSYFGELPTGVFSNSDLAANYAGFKFYRNLTEAMTVGDAKVAPVLEVRSRRWVFVKGRVRNGNPTQPDASSATGAASAANEEAFPPRGLIEPFVSEHWNESFNPGVLVAPMRPIVRAHIARRAERWVAFYRTNRQQEVDRMKRMTTWFGEPYGHRGFEGSITSLEVCFGEVKQAKAVGTHEESRFVAAPQAITPSPLQIPPTDSALAR